MSSERHKFEYESESDLISDYKKAIENPQNLTLATEMIYESLVEEAVMGVSFQMHFESKYPVCFYAIFIQKNCQNKTNFQW